MWLAPRMKGPSLLIRRMLVSVLLLTGCAVSVLGPTSFTARYMSPPGQSKVGVVAACASVKDIAFKDTRADKFLAGSRAPETSPQEKHPIRLKGYAIDWVREGVNATFHRAGLRRSNDGNGRVLVQLTSLDLIELQFNNSEYFARVLLDVVVYAKSSKTSFRVAGEGKNYGTPGDALNYNETITRALDEALRGLIENPAFGQSLCDESAP